MFEKVSLSHPDKVADRIAGAIVDLAYQREENPRCAVEVLLGHGYAYVIIESSVEFTHDDVMPIVRRISGGTIHTLRLLSVPQDKQLAENQQQGMRCGDNGIFCGEYVTDEERELTNLVAALYERWPYDGKFIYDKDDIFIPVNSRLVVCQSNADTPSLMKSIIEHAVKTGSAICMVPPEHIDINPLGEWKGGLDTDSGATNRKLGSDMGQAVTGGGLHGKDLSKADVSVNIMCHLLAERTHMGTYARCAIGDDEVSFYNDCNELITTKKYEDVVREAHEYIINIGGFEKFAEYGIIRPQVV